MKFLVLVSCSMHPLLSLSSYSRCKLFFQLSLVYFNALPNKSTKVAPYNANHASPFAFLIGGWELKLPPDAERNLLLNMDRDRFTPASPERSDDLGVFHFQQHPHTGSSRSRPVVRSTVTDSPAKGSRR